MRMGEGEEAVPICRPVGCPRSNASVWVGRGGGVWTEQPDHAKRGSPSRAGHRPPVPGGKGRPGIRRWDGDDATCPQAGGRPGRERCTSRQLLRHVTRWPHRRRPPGVGGLNYPYARVC